MNSDESTCPVCGCALSPAEVARCGQCGSDLSCLALLDDIEKESAQANNTQIEELQKRIGSLENSRTTMMRDTERRLERTIRGVKLATCLWCGVSIILLALQAAWIRRLSSRKRS